MQLVLGSVIFTESGYAENDWMLGVCSMRKKLPYRIQTIKLLKNRLGGFKSGIGILLAHLPDRKTFGC